MAVNDSRSMNGEFLDGSADNTYITITPDRGGVVENPPLDRLSWPTYRQAEQHIDYPHIEGHIRHGLKPVEHKTRLAGAEQRF